jgi:hypothetical protein
MEEVLYAPKDSFWLIIQPLSPCTCSLVAWLLNAEGTLSFAAVQEESVMSAIKSVLVVMIVD